MWSVPEQKSTPLERPGPLEKNPNRNTPSKKKIKGDKNLKSGLKASSQTEGIRRETGRKNSISAQIETYLWGPKEIRPTLQDEPLLGGVTVSKRRHPASTHGGTAWRRVDSRPPSGVRLWCQINCTRFGYQTCKIDVMMNVLQSVISYDPKRGFEKERKMLYILKLVEKSWNLKVLDFNSKLRILKLE